MGNRLYIATNETQGLTLARCVQRADGFVTRLRGLTFRRSMGEDDALWLVGRKESRVDAAIHMFFVFFPIGVVWLDGEDCVVDKAIARPFRPYYAPGEPAIGVLESKPAVLDFVEIGDRIRFFPREETDET